MKITKYVHSCLLVETSKRTILTDPGGYTYDSHLLQPATLRALDFIVITHEHPDHYSLPLLQQLCAKFPYATIITNEDLAQKLAAEKLPNPISTGSQEDIEVFQAAHEPPSWELPAPANIGVHINGQLTHPGDALHIQSSRDILALPLTAPFASIKESLEAVIAIKPKIIIPIHDWPWHKNARTEYYAKTKEYLGSKGIDFTELENAAPVEL